MGWCTPLIPMHKWFFLNNQWSGDCWKCQQTWNRRFMQNNQNWSYDLVALMLWYIYIFFKLVLPLFRAPAQDCLIMALLYGLINWPPRINQFVFRFCPLLVVYSSHLLETPSLFPHQSFQLDWHKTNWTQFDSVGFSLIFFFPTRPKWIFSTTPKNKFLPTGLTAHWSDSLIVRQVDIDHWTIEQNK